MRNLKNPNGVRIKITLLERQRMIEMHRAGIGFREIGRLVGRNHSVVSRFIRSIPYSPYLSRLSSLELAREMHRRSEERRSVSRKRERLKSEFIRDYVEEKLKTEWSPELIAGCLARQYPELKTNYESIYLWVYKERRDLLQYLLRANPERKRGRASGRRRRYKEPAAPKTSIELRSKEINSRSRLGDWEGDTMVSKQSTFSIFNLVERKSRYMILKRINNCSGSAGAAAMISSLRGLPKEKRHSITLDNGPENSSHDLVAKELGVDVFFCHPHCASERGTVENRNGFVRRTFPKKTDFSNVSVSQLQTLQDKHNHRPMKCLGFRTPYEVFQQAV